MDDFDPYRFDTPDSYALKTGDPSTGGLTDPAQGALPSQSTRHYLTGGSGGSVAETAFGLIAAIAFLVIAIASW